MSCVVCPPIYTPRTGSEGFMMHSIHDLLEIAIKHKASDLVIKAGAVPALRVDGRMQLTDLPVISAAATRELAYEIMFSAARDTLLQTPKQTTSGWRWTIPKPA